MTAPSPSLDADGVVALLRARFLPMLVAVDGLPVSGKSTLVGRLEAELGAVTIHLDDFVRPEAEWRGQAGPGFPFPYIRYAEFLEAVRAVARGEPARYRRYDWASGTLEAAPHVVEPGGIVVVEGVSALHPELAPLYDIRFWIDSDADTMLDAALARGAGDWADDWRNLFMPSVARYLETAPQSRAEYRVRGRGAGAD